MCLPEIQLYLQCMYRTLSFLIFLPPCSLHISPAGGDLLNLGNPSALAYMTSYLSSAVGNYSLDVLRLDFNTDPAPNWAAADAPGFSGLVEMRYVAGLYEMWDTIVSLVNVVISDTKLIDNFTR